MKNWTVITAILLLVALCPLPYGYYQFLRFAVCIFMVVGGSFLHKDESDTQHLKHRFIMLGLAVLFNPVIPIHLSKEVWMPIDVATAIYLLVMIRPKIHNVDFD